MRKNSMRRILSCAIFSVFSLVAVQVQAEKAGHSGNPDRSEKFNKPPIKVTGKVSDVRNNPLAGATVTIKGTRISTATDATGNFTLSNVPDNAILQISFSGYLTEEIAAKSVGSKAISMREQINQLTDVVVVGYGTAKKKDLTGAVVQIKATQLENENARSVQDMLRGNAPGLDVGFSASPKGGGSLQVRGRASLTASTSPLIVVDGVIYPGDLSDINPNDINTIDVLKDASSAAVFGARSANGVILVNTKRGKSGKPVITFNSNYTMNRISKWPGLLKPEEFWNWRGDVIWSQRGFDSTSRPGIKYFSRDPRTLPSDITVDQWLGLAGQVGLDPVTVWLQRLGGGTGTQPVSIESYKNNTPIDWEGLILNKNGRQHDHTVSVSGKTGATTYYTSLGVFDNEGMSQGERFKTFRSRLNLETEVAKFLTFGINMQFSSRDEGQTPVSIGDMLGTSPFGNLYQADGRLRPSANDDVGNNTNPLMTPTYVKRLIKSNNLFGSIYAKGKLPLGFSYQVNYTPRFEWFQNYQHISSQRPLLETRGGITSRQDDRTFQWQIDNLLMWNKKFGKHSIDATGLFNAEKFQFYSSTINAEQYLPNDNLGWSGVQSAGIKIISTNDQYQTGDAIMGRINYGYDEKYLFTFTGRRDGFSAFGQGNPRAFFPSAALGWVLSDEKFMSKATEVFDYMKLRLSYGENGNREVGRYAALSQMSAGNYVYTTPAGANVTVGAVQTSNMSNPNLRWERQASVNVGFDFSLKGGKISGSMDYYVRKTNDLLVNRALPNVTGFTSVITNLGKVDNSGFEFSLNTENIKTNNFSWRSSFSIWNNRNKIISLYGPVPVTDASGKTTLVEQDDRPNGWFINRNINTVWDFNVLGVWGTGDVAEARSYGFAPGDFRLEDVNKDGKLTVDDKVFLGQTAPKLSFNLRNEFTLYKNWDVSFQLYGRIGQLSQFNEAANTDRFYDRAQFYKRPYWTPTNQNQNYARMMSSIGSGIGFNVWRKSSFLRLNNISLAYNMPKNAISKFGVQGLKFYFNVQNALVVSPWEFFDPENKGFTPSYGTFGLNLTL
jgi:TonB-linked SusC/RagA family outer membrane protein